jgi:outer membrane protein assembly factor BamB/predicted phosphodiesterase
MATARCSGLAAAVVVAVGTATAAATPVSGTVFADRDGDGVFDRDEVGVATIVAWEDVILARTDAAGRFTLDIPDDGLVWARVPDGYRPGPAWVKATVAADDPLDIPLVPLAPDEAARPLTFVVAADTHLHHDERHYGRRELAAAMRQATALDPPPRFFTILGDVTQANQPDELRQIAEAASALAVPWIPVAGNHDWYDGGVAWRAAFGPESYSFDIGDVHFVVVNTTADPLDIIGFLERELAFVPPDATIVVMAHAPLGGEVIDVMRQRGVDLFLAGHWHVNRVWDHGSLVELDTEPFLMGGMDFTPAGYRIVTIEAGSVRVAHRSFVRAPWVRVVGPSPAGCARAGASLIVAAAIDARDVTVVARIAGATIPLTATGGWTHAGALPRLSPGRHTVEVEVRAGDRRVIAATDTVVACAAEPAAAVRIDDWRQPGGDAAHAGAQPSPIRPPLVERWAAAVGGPVSGTVVASGRVFVAVMDLAAGNAGGVVALDGDTGAELWRTLTPTPIRAAPVVVSTDDGDRVVAVQTQGVVVAYDAATGREVWRRDLGAGVDALVATVFASPAAADGVVWVGGQRRFAALDAATGAPRWTVDPVPTGVWYATLAGPAVGADRVIATFERSRGGVLAWTRAGEPAWQLAPELVYATNAAPVIVDGTVVIATGMGDVLAVAADDGRVMWTRMLTDDRHDWGYAIAASPAVAHGVVVVATEHDRLWALELATGDALWSWSPADSVLHHVHYRGRARGFTGSPVITGDVVWAAATDGTLTALDLRTGALLDRVDVGAPVLAGVAAAGELLLVAAWDGTLHAFQAGAPRPRRGRGAGAPELVALGVILVQLGLGWARRRPRRRS